VHHSTAKRSTRTRSVHIRRHGHAELAVCAAACRVQRAVACDHERVLPAARHARGGDAARGQRVDAHGRARVVRAAQAELAKLVPAPPVDGARGCRDGVPPAAIDEGDLRSASLSAACLPSSCTPVACLDTTSKETRARESCLRIAGHQGQLVQIHVTLPERVRTCSEARPSTSTGVVIVSKLPCPSWPYLLQPHE
jgi:hypothetical protein